LSLSVSVRALVRRLPMGAIPPVVALVVVETLARWGALDSRFVPTPSTVAAGAIELLSSGELWPALAATLVRTLSGFVLATLVGVPCGLVLGRYPGVRPYVMPTVELLRAIPGVALLPLALLWFGSGTGSLVPVVAFAALFPILVDAMHGAEEVPRILVQSGRVLGLTRTGLLFRVVLPASVPQILTGLRLGVVYALTSAIGAEIITGENGLGFLILDYQRTLQSPKMFATMILVALTGFAASAALTRLERKNQGQAPISK
jgi:NitT/TauT family transport system permease protein